MVFIHPHSPTLIADVYRLSIYGIDLCLASSYSSMFHFFSFYQLPLSKAFQFFFYIYLEKKQKEMYTFFCASSALGPSIEFITPFTHTVLIPLLQLRTVSYYPFPLSILPASLPFTFTVYAVHFLCE